LPDETWAASPLPGQDNPLLGQIDHFIHDLDHPARSPQAANLLQRLRRARTHLAPLNGSVPTPQETGAAARLLAPVLAEAHAITGTELAHRQQLFEARLSEALTPDARTDF